MVRSVGPAGLERIELKRLTQRLGQLFTVLQEAAEAQMAEVPGAWVPPVDVCETADAICLRIELPGVLARNINAFDLRSRYSLDEDANAAVRKF